jgi:hypothetical protein
MINIENPHNKEAMNSNLEVMQFNASNFILKYDSSQISHLNTPKFRLRGKEPDIEDVASVVSF